MSKKVAIIGAGASGIFCAIHCAKAGLKVDIFEQNSKSAKKILVSGNGRCNITNTKLSTNDYFSQNSQFVEHAFKEYGFKEFEKFCNAIGLLLDVKEDGRAYPLSNEAKSVAKIFEDYARGLGVIFHLDTKISNIQELIQKYDAVVVATGSEAASHLGGNNNGHIFAEQFGHTIVPTYPSLVQLHLNSNLAKKMSGAKVDGEVTLLLNKKKELTSSGDILFTNYGVSGFSILDISQQASLALKEYQAVDISVNLLPKFTTQKLAAHIMNLVQTMHSFTLLDILVGLVPLKIAQGIIEEIQLSADMQVKKIDMKLAKKIANTLTNWRFEVTETHGFRHAEVSGGGVNTDEIDPKTMHSRKQKNLYFCGEVLDVVGRRGGYNFAFAWASAYLSAKDILNKK